MMICFLFYLMYYKSKQALHASDMYNFSLMTSEHTPYTNINPPNVAAIVETVESISIIFNYS